MAAITVGFLGSMTSHGAYVSIQCLETRNCAIYLVSTCGNYLSTKVGGGILSKLRRSEGCNVFELFKYTVAAPEVHRLLRGVAHGVDML